MEKWFLQLFAEGEGGAQEGGLVEQQAESPEAEAQPENPYLREHWNRVNQIYDDWMEQAGQLQQLFPDFDIRRDLEDPRFEGMLLTGVDIGDAYQALHARDILPAAMEYAARTVEARLAQSMRSGASRPGENGLGGGGAVMVGRNVSNMTRQDYAKVCRMVERGERVSFG